MPLNYPSPCPRTNKPTTKGHEIKAYIIQRKQEGASFATIARELDRTGPYIHKMYKKAMKEHLEETIDEHRKLELSKISALEEQLVRLLQNFQPLVSGGKVVYTVAEDEEGNILLDKEGNKVLVKLEDMGAKLQTIDRIIKLMERKARLLGLDAPTKVAATDPKGEKEAGWTLMLSPEDASI